MQTIRTVLIACLLVILNLIGGCGGDEASSRAATPPHAATAQAASEQPRAVSGSEIYRAVDDKLVVKLISSTEMELSQGRDHFVCEYKRDGEQIRATLEALGTKRAVYFDIIPDGLRDEGGTILYNADRYAQVLADMTAQRAKQSLNESLLKACERGELAAAESALQQGAEIDVKDQQIRHKGFTPLHHAAASGNPALTEYLLKQGADPNAIDESGNTPLIFSVSKEHIETTQILVAAGADPAIRNQMGWTAFDFTRNVSRSKVEPLREALRSSAEADGR